MSDTNYNDIALQTLVELAKNAESDEVRLQAAHILLGVSQ